MAAPVPTTVPNTIAPEEDAARTLHDVANLVMAMRSASEEAALDIEQACRAAPSDVRHHMRCAAKSLFLLEHAGRLAAHTLRRRPQTRPTSPAAHIGLGDVADLPAVLDLAARAAEPIVGSRTPIRLEAGEVSSVVGHKSELAMVFFNVFINAYQAMGSGVGHIDVSFHQSGDRVCVQIRDTGPGMNAEQLGNAFRSGYSSRGGRGIGLSICREIVERYGGHIKLVNADGLVVLVYLRAQ